MRASRFIVLPLILLMASCSGGGGGGGGGDTTGGGDTGGGGGTTGRPDFTVSIVSAPASANMDDTIDVVVKVTNMGADAYGASVAMGFNYYGTPGDTSQANGVAIFNQWFYAGTSAQQTIRVNVPSDAPTYNAYKLEATVYGSDDANPGNNTAVKTIAITGTNCMPDSAEQDNTAATAKVIAGGSSAARNHCDGSGDWFKFTATSGSQYGIRADGWSMSTPAIALYGPDASTVLASVMGGNNRAKILWTAPASGTYYFRVRDVFGLNAFGETKDYTATLGDMRPDLQALGISGSSTVVQGGMAWITDNVANRGFADAGAFDVNFYLSADETIDAGDTLVGTRHVDALAQDQSSSGDYSVSYPIPQTTATGNYYIAAVVDPAGAVNEFDENNNVTAVFAPITVTAPVGCTPDAFEDDDIATGAQVIPVGGGNQDRNFCGDATDWMKFSAGANTEYAIRLSGYDFEVTLYDTDGVTQLQQSGNTWGSGIDWTAPKAGTYYIHITNRLGETRDGRTYTIKVDPRLADLAAISLSGGSSVPQGGFLSLRDYFRNKGYVASGPFTVGIYRSSDGTIDASDTRMMTQSFENAGAGTDHYNDYKVQIPKTLAAGTYYFGVIVDDEGVVAELSESNNTSPTAVAVNVVIPSCALDIYEDDDAVSQAYPITVGEVQTHNFCEDTQDWVSFMAPNDGTYLLTTEGTLGKDVTIKDAAGAQVQPHAAYWDGSPVSFVATAGQSYSIKISDAFTSNYSDYPLAITQCALDAYEEDDTQASAKPMPSAQKQLRNLCDDGADWVSFEATAGVTYTFTGTNDGTKSNIEMGLFDAAGTELTHVGNGKRQLTLTWTPTTSGTLYLRVKPYVSAFGLNQEYSLTLN